MPPDPVRPPPSPPPPPPTREALSAAAAERRAATEDEEETPLLDETAAPVVPVVARAERDLSHLFGALAFLRGERLLIQSVQLDLHCWFSWPASR